ncbi:hypothetical protein BI375_05875 [Vibrio rotiferianus]|uniref:Uncharacterized protein n=1 Tax=Vibrio rotiferianus TaxID=190895 RepID=A0ABX3D8Z7_9VIBR|nr:hypothetical protein [Vibrio rotiferianus]OHY92986.1 hypothetical protein BI375_05875 [Vibrio rotiferianus]
MENNTGRDSDGKFVKGNKISTGRQLGARGRYQKAVDFWNEQGFNPLEATAMIYADPDSTPEQKLKAVKIATDVEAKVMASEPPTEAENKPIEQINQELSELLSLAYFDSAFGVLPYAMMTLDQLDYLGRSHEVPYHPIQ